MMNKPLPVNSIVGEGANFKGELKSPGACHINGAVEGKIEAEGEVIISERSRIDGEVKGSKILVSGEIKGNVIASGEVEIAKSGKIFGDISAGKLSIEEGASYSGKVNIGSSAPTE